MPQENQLAATASMPMVDAQLARHDLHHLRLAAMAVEQQQLAQAGPADGRADLVPDPPQRLGRQGERAGEVDMLVALADGGGRQHQHRQAGRHQVQGAADDAVD